MRDCRIRSVIRVPISVTQPSVFKRSASDDVLIDVSVDLSFDLSFDALIYPMADGRDLHAETCSPNLLIFSPGEFDYGPPASAALSEDRRGRQATRPRNQR